MIVVLCRSDIDILHITFVQDATEGHQLADILGNMQAFVVEVVALLIETPCILDKIADYHIINSWYNISLNAFMISSSDVDSLSSPPK